MADDAEAKIRKALETERQVSENTKLAQAAIKAADTARDFVKAEIAQQRENNDASIERVARGLLDQLTISWEDRAKIQKLELAASTKETIKATLTELLPGYVKSELESIRADEQDEIETRKRKRAAFWARFNKVVSILTGLALLMIAVVGAYRAMAGPPDITEARGISKAAEIFDDTLN